MIIIIIIVVVVVVIIITITIIVVVVVVVIGPRRGRGGFETWLQVSSSPGSSFEFGKHSFELRSRPEDHAFY